MTQLEFIEMHQLIDQYESLDCQTAAMSHKDYIRMIALKEKYNNEEERVQSHAGWWK